MEPSIGPLQPEHIERVRDIERQSFPLSWPAESFDNELEKNKVARYLALHHGDMLIGYSGMWLIMDECHITTIAVDPAWRGQKMGKRLLWEMLRICHEEGAKWAVLEVRESNAAALAMYRRFGFRQIGVRKRYYENDENALVMWVGKIQTRAFGELLEAEAVDWALTWRSPEFAPEAVVTAPAPVAFRPLRRSDP